MSGYSGRLKIGMTVLHKEKKKKVRNWHFIAGYGYHDSDLIVIEFTDDTDTGGEGFLYIQYLDELCNTCKNCIKKRVYTADSFEMVFNWFCGAFVVNRIIEEYVETFDKVKTPKWCPLMRHKFKNRSFEF